MSSKITQAELESYLWGSAVLLRNHIDAGAYKQYIFPLLFFKRLNDVYEEETARAVAENGPEAANWEEIHSYSIPDNAHWNDVRNVSENVGKAIQAAFRAIEKANSDKLAGIFGDGTWTNKNRLPDRLLKDLLEHFSSKTLSIENCPEDEFGQGYEYLIKKFADDSGHTAQEFYTNRTVVHLMTEILKPQPGESIYDPTCGSAGMLISSVAHLRSQGQEWRNVSLFGQEINALTSAIAKMNLFLHGIEDFSIVNGDTLAAPAFIDKGKLKRFDIVLANPPYSISTWNRSAFESDKYGRNAFGVPPQSRADYAFIQHIICSMRDVTGRCAILLPHGALNRSEEAEIRRNIIETDVIDCVIGLGRSLFYNSGLESCILVCRKSKPEEHKDTILFIEAEKYQHRIKDQAFLYDDDIAVIINAYNSKQDIPGISRRVSKEEILANDGNLNIKLYVDSADAYELADVSIEDILHNYISARLSAWKEIDALNEEQTQFPFKKLTVLEHSVSTESWVRVKLSDVATEYSERVDDPSQSSYERYIGSDCIDRYDLRVKRSQNAAKVHSAQKAFKAGDYLLVRRSLYGSDFRERAPMADFDGVCSADILTIRPNEKIYDKYLAVVLYSTELWKFIVSNSTGSLTRRIKWKQLQDFSFLLPPMNLQKFYADLVWEAYDLAEEYHILLENINDLIRLQFVEMFGDPVDNPMHWPTKSLTSIGTCKNGMNFHAGEAGVEINCLGVGDFKDYAVITDTSILPLVSLKAMPESEYLLQDGDIVFVRSNGNKALVGRSLAVYPGDTPTTFSGFCIRFRNSDIAVKTEYLLQVLKADSIRKRMQGRGANIQNLNQQVLSSLEIPLPPLELQERFLLFLEKTDKSKSELKRAMNSASGIYRRILQEAFASED